MSNPGEKEEGEGFHCVVASEVVEHIDNLLLFLHLLSSSVKPKLLCAAKVGDCIMYHH